MAGIGATPRCFWYLQSKVGDASDFLNQLAPEANALLLTNFSTQRQLPVRLPDEIMASFLNDAPRSLAKTSSAGSESTTSLVNFTTVALHFLQSHARRDKYGNCRPGGPSNSSHKTRKSASLS